MNNGGYRSTFVNSSCKYALTVVPALVSVGCDTTAALTQRAIDALNLHPLSLKAIEDSIFKPNPDRNQALDALDKQFYKIFEIEPKLFAFVESRQEAFVLEKMFVEPRPPRRGNRNLIKLGVSLEFAPQTDRTFEAVRKLAGEIAIQKGDRADRLRTGWRGLLFPVQFIPKNRGTGTLRNIRRTRLRSDARGHQPLCGPETMGRETDRGVELRPRR